MTKPAHSIMLARTINAASQSVYSAWTNPKAKERWLGKVSTNIRAGGRYRFESKAEGGRTYIYTGEYLALEPTRHIIESFLAGEPDPAAANPYPNEFIEIKLRDLAPSKTELTFINGRDGEAMSEAGTSYGEGSLVRMA